MDSKAVVFEKVTHQYSDSYHWFRIDLRALQNEGPSDLLHIHNPLISELNIWRKVDGQLQALDGAPIPHQYPVILLKAKPGEEFSILLKIFLPDITAVSFDTSPPAITAYDQPVNSFSFGFILCGFAAGLLVYNFILFMFLREKDLAYFSLYAFCLILGTFGASGGFTVLGLPTWLNRWMPCFAAVAIASGVNFTRSFLDSKRISPWFDTFLLGCQVSALGFGLLLVLNLSRKFQYLIDINMIVSLLGSITFAAVAWKRGHNQAKNYLIGWSGYIVALFILTAMQYNVLPRTMVTENAQMFALDLQFLVLSAAIGTKITRMRAELLKQLQEANMVLEKKVEERTRTVIEQQQTLIQSAKMASLGEMAGGIAHEINNPLMIINGYAENLHTMIQKNQLTPEKAASFQERIHKATDRIRNIVNGLRKLSRETSHDELRNCIVSDLIKDALSVCESRFSNHGIDLRVSLPIKDVMVCCNMGQISQILINLLNNSFDAIELVDNSWVEIRVEELREKVTIRVIDSGPGIPIKVVERIFDPFFTTKEIGKGTGLGLSISKSIIERHGGRIYVDVEVPNTCFVLELRKNIDSTKTAA